MTWAGFDSVEGWDAPVPCLEIELGWAFDVSVEGAQDAIWPAGEEWSQLTEAHDAEVDMTAVELEWLEVLRRDLEFDPSELLGEDFR